MGQGFVPIDFGRQGGGGGGDGSTGRFLLAMLAIGLVFGFFSSVFNLGNSQGNDDDLVVAAETIEQYVEQTWPEASEIACPWMDLDSSTQFVYCTMIHSGVEYRVQIIRDRVDADGTAHIRAGAVGPTLP
jgi:hypothetical protein